MEDVEVRGAPVEVVEDVVSLRSLRLSLVRPRDPEALLDEEAFERDEFLPYWAELWPSALALARALESRSLHGVRVAELGCGLGLPSVVAALRGARVLATDWSEDAVRFAAANARRNAARIETAVCSWAAAAELLAGAPWPLVVAADVLYETRNGDELLALLPRLLEPGGEALVADPGRPGLLPFLERAAAGWELESQADPEAPRVHVHRLVRR